MIENRPPRVVISVDFELRWGVHDVLGANPDAYRPALEGVRVAVPRLLEMFAQRSVKATWATVGALACRGWDEYFERTPPPPSYADARLAFDCRWSERDPEGELHFAPELVQAVVDTPGQELGSHTFNHIFFGEMGVMARDVIADTRATNQLFEERFGRRPQSLVFPRNQVGFLNLLAAEGVAVVRTNLSAWYWGNVNSSPPLLFRSMRFLEGFSVWQRHAAAARADAGSGVACTQASMFLRLAKLPPQLFRLQLEKLRREAERLRDGDVLHLWFHDHNLGANPDDSLGRASAVLDTLARCLPSEARYATMGELQN